MEVPEIVIVVEGGLVSSVATANDKLTYRIIDLDALKVDPGHSIEDLEADETNINVENYTAGVTKQTDQR